MAIEPLHPMYAGDKSAIISLGQANDMCESIASPWVGVAIDVYHLWWDIDLKIKSSDAEKIKIFSLYTSVIGVFQQLTC